MQIGKQSKALIHGSSVLLRICEHGCVSSKESPRPGATKLTVLIIGNASTVSQQWLSTLCLTFGQKIIHLALVYG